MSGSVLDYADLTLAALYAAVVVVLGVQLRRVHLRPSGPTAALLAFFALRAVARVNDAPQLHSESITTVNRVVDVLSIVLVVYLLTLTRRVVAAFRFQQDAAQSRADEYERALAHYTQVVRHRTMNPITIISGTLLTLRDGPQLDAQMRIELCDAALAAAHELHEVILEPERRDALEHELEARPRLDDERRDRP